jgi:hypothetical protein
VDLGSFGYNRGGGLRKLPNSLMRHTGQVIVVKWAVRFGRVELRRWVRCSVLSAIARFVGSCDGLTIVTIVDSKSDPEA